MNDDAELNAAPTDTPPAYLYVWSKAKQYLRVGPAVYRKQDFFKMPPITWGDDRLTLVAEGFRQVLAWRGMTEDRPFTGLGIEGFYAMMSVVHFECESQTLLPNTTPDRLLDRMTMRHGVDGRELVLFNEVAGICDPRALP